MADLYIVDFGGDDNERARREVHRDAERRRLRQRYVQHLVDRAGRRRPPNQFHGA